MLRRLFSSLTGSRGTGRVAGGGGRPAAGGTTTDAALGRGVRSMFDRLMRR